MELKDIESALDKLRTSLEALGYKIDSAEEKNENKNETLSFAVNGVEDNLKVLNKSVENLSQNIEANTKAVIQNSSLQTILQITTECFSLKSRVMKGLTTDKDAKAEINMLRNILKVSKLPTKDIEQAEKILNTTYDALFVSAENTL